MVERHLMSLFPQENWCQLSHLLIFHGRRACSARSACCSDHAICQEFGTCCELPKQPSSKATPKEAKAPGRKPKPAGAAAKRRKPKA
jgi:hypothetical protein